MLNGMIIFIVIIIEYAKLKVLTSNYQNKKIFNNIIIIVAYTFYIWYIKYNNRAYHY